MLGHNWLTHYNMLIDWVLGSIKFCSPLQTNSLTSPETVATAPLSSDPLTLTPLVILKVSFINAAAFTHISKMDDNQVYQLFLSDKTTPDDVPVNMTGVPPDFHESTDIFSKTCTDKHGCRSQHLSNCNSASVKHLLLLPSPTASSQPTPPCSIHHLSSIIHHQWQLLISSLLKSHCLDFLDIQ